MNARTKQRKKRDLEKAGVSQDMIKILLMQTLPVERIFRQLAELGVPRSMTEEMCGLSMDAWSSAGDRENAKLQALWQLAEGYWDVACHVPGSIECIDQAIDEAKQMGVYYDPPSCAYAIIALRAYLANKNKKMREFNIIPEMSTHDHFEYQKIRGQIRLNPMPGKPHEIMKEANDKQEKAITLKLHNVGDDRIAQRLKVNIDTVKRWFSDPAIQLRMMADPRFKGQKMKTKLSRTYLSEGKATVRGPNRKAHGKQPPTPLEM